MCEESGLDWYYFGARYYDPAIARWLQVDPLASKYPSWSPYYYTLNSPINKVDPDGRNQVKFWVCVAQAGIKGWKQVSRRRAVREFRNLGDYKVTGTGSRKESKKVARKVAGKNIKRDTRHTLNDGKTGLPHYQRVPKSKGSHGFWSSLGAFLGIVAIRSC